MSASAGRAPSLGDLAGPGRRPLAPSEIAEHRPIALVHEGRPAMALLTRVGGLPAPAQACGLVLAEGSDGLPYGYLAHVEGHVLSARRDRNDDAWSMGIALADRWLDGSLLLEAHARGLVSPSLLPGFLIRSTVDGIRAALPACGFSASFVDLLDCVSRWPARERLGDGDFTLLCGDASRTVALREFCRANPMLAAAGAHVIGERFRNGHGVDAAGLVPSVSPAKVRRLAEPAWDPLDRSGEHFDAMLDMIHAVPVDWLPVDAKGVQGFLTVSRAVAACAGLCIETWPLVRASRGDWYAFAARCEANGGGRIGSRHGADPYLDDPAEHLASKVVAPALRAFAAGRMDPTACLFVAPRLGRKLMYGGKGLSAILKAATEWHRVLDRLQREIPADETGMAWPALLPDATFGDVSLSCLVTSVDVRDEGLAGPDRHGVPGLNHCVGTYVQDAEAGRCHLVSLRRASPDGRGERLATAEIRQSPDGTVGVRQFRGHRNGEPPEGCREALDAYLAGPVPYLPPRSPLHAGRLRAGCGYDPEDRELVRQACRAYARFLPRHLRQPEALAAWAVGILGTGDLP